MSFLKSNIINNIPGQEGASVIQATGMQNDSEITSGVVYPTQSSTFDYSNLSGLQAWYDGNDVLNGSNPATGTKFATWVDKSANAYNATQATAANQYKWIAGAINGNGAVFSDGSLGENWMGIAHGFFTSGQPCSVFLTFKADTTHASYIFWNDKTANLPAGGGPFLSKDATHIYWYADQVIWADSQYDGVMAANTIYMVRLAYDGAATNSSNSFKCYINEVLLNRTGNAVGGGAVTTMIGGDGGDPGLCGYILDVAVVNDVSDADAARILTYEQAKWGF